MVLSSMAPYGNPWNKLDDVMVETVLARLLTADIFSCMFVCKRWDSIIHSPTFSTTSNQLSERLPWFLMFNDDNVVSVVYDMEVSEWRRIKLPLPSWITGTKPGPPAVACGGLVCFRTGINSLSVCNPLTGKVRSLPSMLCHVKREGLCRRTTDYVLGVAMHLSSTSKNYKVFVAFGIWPYLCLRVFSSEENSWAELLVSGDVRVAGDVPWPVERSSHDNTVDWALVRWKGVATIGNEGQVLVYYITPSGKLLCFDTQKVTIMCPNVPIEADGLELVDCGGRFFLVVLENAWLMGELCILEFNHENAEWKRIATMPPNMLQACCGNPTTINCSGNGDYIMVCANSVSSSRNFNKMVMYNMKRNTWVELPPYPYFEPGFRKVCSLSFKPDIDAKV